MGLLCKYTAKKHVPALYRVTLVRLDGHKIVVDCNSWELHNGHIILFLENGSATNYSLDHYKLDGGVEGSIKRIK